jgi:hypothetical protein
LFFLVKDPYRYLRRFIVFLQSELTRRQKEKGSAEDRRVQPIGGGAFSGN